MLEIVRYNKDEYNFPCLLVLGCFDGIHIGHSDLLKKAKLQAKINGLDLGVMTFTHGKDGKQVFTFEERIKILESYNVKFVLKIDFTDDFKKTEPLEFLKNLEDKLNIKAFMSGKDFRFGAQAKGKSATLKKYAEDDDSGVWYMPVKDITEDDEKVGTSKIKALLAQGEITHANSLLGRNFSVSGTVVQGASRGHSILGFPTVNIAYPQNKAEIKQGVYIVKCTADGATYDGIANYGARPTFNEDNALLEVHLKDFNDDLYGKEVTVEIIDFIREIQKFENADALKVQLVSDFAKIGGVVSEVTEGKAGEEPVPEPEVQEVTETAVEAEVCADKQPAEEETAVVETVLTPEFEEVAVAEEPQSEQTDEEPVAVEPSAPEPEIAEVIVEKISETVEEVKTAESPDNAEVKAKPKNSTAKKSSSGQTTRKKSGTANKNGGAKKSTSGGTARKKTQNNNKAGGKKVD